MREEPGAKKVAAALSGSSMSVVNHAELVSYYAKAGSDPATIEAMLRALPIEQEFERAYETTAAQFAPAAA